MMVNKIRFLLAFRRIDVSLEFCNNPSKQKVNALKLTKNNKDELKDKMIEHLFVAKLRGFNDKTMRLTINEIEIIIECLGRLV